MGLDTSKTPNTASSKSGIQTDASGERHIPSSVRADGSKRKEIKIRPGYKPPEDVEVYKNRTAEAWKTRGVSGSVPGAASTEETSTTDSKTAASNKNAKRREARKKAKAKDEGEGEGKREELEDRVEAEMKTAEAINTASAAPTPDAPASDPDAEKEKQVKRLIKRLRQARDLEDKKSKGENLLPEQFEKVIKIQELTRQLNNLGFDASDEIGENS